MPSHWWTDSGLEGFLKKHLIYLFIFIVQISNASFHFMFSSILILFFVKLTQIFLHSRSIRTNWATRKPPANRNDGEHFCIFVFVYLCICVFVYLCICDFANRNDSGQTYFLNYLYSTNNSKRGSKGDLEIDSKLITCLALSEEMVCWFSHRIRFGIKPISPLQLKY